MKFLFAITIFSSSASAFGQPSLKADLATDDLRSETSVMESNVSVSFKIRTVAHDKNDEMARIKLEHAQKIANLLFESVQNKGMIVAGKTEEQLNNEIVKLAREKFGVGQHWHKKIVRTGINTLATYGDNPPDRTIQADDILFLDFGIVVDGWESDFARTYVLGANASKKKLKDDVEKAWYQTQEWVHGKTALTASELFRFTRAKAREYGWTSAGEIAGHIVGKFPHEQPPDPASHDLDVYPDIPTDLFAPDANGNKRHWILEIHFVDNVNKIGGYFEQLL